MLAPSASRFLLPRAVAATVLLLTLACSGGGGGGPTGPGDRTPPDAPDLTRISTDVPTGGETTVRGEVGSVEARSTVVVENLTVPSRNGGTRVVVEANASVEGAFLVRVPAIIGDQISALARDEAGNAGPSVTFPAGPSPETFRLDVVSGDDQFGVVGRALTEPFRVRARGGNLLQNLVNVEVVFEVTSGQGTFDRASARTDAEGVAQALLTLGPVQGPVLVRARMADAPREVLFEAIATGAPELTTVTPPEAERGSSVVLSGRNFSPIAAHNVVEFNGVQADVQSAAPDRLSVAVPAFGSDGPLTVTLTGVRSNGLPFKVTGPPPVLPEVGSVQAPLRLTTPSGSSLTGEVRLGYLTGTEEYVVAVQALATAGGAQFRHTLAGDEAQLPPSGETAAAAVAAGASSAQSRWDAALRNLEGALAEDAKGKPRVGGLRLAQEAEIGDRRSFEVVNKLGSISLTDPTNFDTVNAILRYKGAHTLVYVDERVTAVELNDAGIRDVGDRFDRQTYDVDKAAFGNESDIDGDGRVTILLTATVNALNQGASPSDGFVIGFFFGLDLLPGLSPNTSNAREIFYGFVPDPGGRFGPRVSREFAIETLNEVFAHEFQHMISFNEHVLVRGGQVEDLWLNEGLSHLAEQLNGFHEGNDIRAALYLADPGATGLAVAGGGDGLADRGAAFLFLRWLGDQVGEGIFRTLVQTRNTGTANVQLATNQAFTTLFSDWFAALFLDEAGLGTDPRFQIPSLPVRASYEAVRTQRPELSLGPYLAIQSLRLPGQNLSDTTAGTAGTFYAVTSNGGTAERRLRISAPGSSQGQVTIIRTR